MLSFEPLKIYARDLKEFQRRVRSKRIDQLMQKYGYKNYSFSGLF